MGAVGLIVRAIQASGSWFTGPVASWVQAVGSIAAVAIAAGIAAYQTLEARRSESRREAASRREHLHRQAEVRNGIAVQVASAATMSELHGKDMPSGKIAANVHYRQWARSLASNRLALELLIRETGDPELLLLVVSFIANTDPDHDPKVPQATGEVLAQEVKLKGVLMSKLAADIAARIVLLNAEYYGLPD